ncbi:MAG: hypothetical protein JWM68_2494 [Verrucomicrobiales bacterium]|nr:hypothetical protein [Verrucomicrobiales bacterium]
MPHDNCPNCGADLPRKAKVCPECGSDEKTGWSDEAHVGGLNLPDDNFDYDEFVENEFGEKTRIKPKSIHWAWWVAAIVVLAALIIPLAFSLLRR